LKFSFWSLNGGLMMMCVLSLLPVGLMQTFASVDQGYWYARSPEFLQTDLMQTLRWLRAPGDTVFFLGAVVLVMFVAGLKSGHSFRRPMDPDDHLHPRGVEGELSFRTSRDDAIVQRVGD